jgi:hypothetical protein
MSYALIKDNSVEEYPLEEGVIKNRFPRTSFPSPFEPPAGYVEITDAPQPEIDHTKNITEGTPQNIGGLWTRTWLVSNATPEQIEERTDRRSVQARQDRNRRLAECDWTQLPDAPVDKEVWAAYRQDLRDVSSQAGFPWDITWPEAP